MLFIGEIFFYLFVDNNIADLNVSSPGMARELCQVSPFLRKQMLFQAGFKIVSKRIDKIRDKSF